MNKQSPSDKPLDFDTLMQANLKRVFGEKDSHRRLEAIRELYADDAVLYEPDSSAKGHAAISEAVSKLLTQLPPDFAFQAVRPAAGHHNVARLQWRSGPPNGAAVATGTDVAHFIDGRIHSLYVFLDPMGA